MAKDLVQQYGEALRLLLDVPEERVAFGFDGYASTLTSAIMGTEPHFTVGVFGGWGSGKTTLLRRIEAQLKSGYSHKALVLFFDAWRYQREEHMLLPLLDTLSNSLKEEQEHWQMLGNKVKRLSRAIIGALTMKVPGMEVKADEAVKRWEEAEEFRSDYYNWLSELQTALQEARRADFQRRIVILIDDLDRCVPHKVIEVLESIKVILDVTGFVFVLALDQQIVEKAIESYYGEKYGIEGRDYLKKLVQVEFHLPPLRPQDVIDYARILMQSLSLGEDQASATLAEVVPLVAGDNPREVKRFINRVLLGTAIIRNAGVAVPPTCQVAFMAMDFRWSGIIRMLYSDKTLLERIGAYIEAKAEGREIPQSDEETGSAKTILENNRDLEPFLERSPGKELLGLNTEQLNQLLFYSSITKETSKVEALEDTIEDILMTLVPREHRIIGLRFGLDDGRFRTLEEVGKEWGLTGERIRQIQAIALRKLRHPSRSQQLRTVLGSMSELNINYQRLLLEIFGTDWQQYILPR